MAGSASVAGLGAKVGSSAQPGSLTAFNTLESLVGRLGAWRIYVSAAQPGSYDVARIKTCLAEGRRPMVSVPGSTNVTTATNAAKAFVQLVGPLGGPGTVTFGHEPTQKYPDPKTYVAAKNAFYRTIRSSLPGWACMDVFMLWDIESRDPSRHPDRWVADRSLVSAFGIDAYDQGKRTPARMLSAALALAEKYRLPLWIAETATIEDPNRPNYKADWIRAFASLARSDPRIAGWLWFHSNIGKNAPPYGWYVDTSPQATAAFKLAVATSS